MFGDVTLNCSSTVLYRLLKQQFIFNSNSLAESRIIVFCNFVGQKQLLRVSGGVIAMADYKGLENICNSKLWVVILVYVFICTAFFSIPL